MDILLTWVGARDPSWVNSRTGQEEFGPVLALLHSRQFDAVYLFFNLHSNSGDDFRQRANAIFHYCRQHFPNTVVKHRPIDLVSVIDYREIFRRVNHECQAILKENEELDPGYFVYLSPGTPQMQTVWVLLTQSRLLQARMLDATPIDLLMPGAPSWREIDLSLSDFPQVVNLGETARMVGVLQAQNDNLVAENLRLKAELAAFESGAELAQEVEIQHGFSLRAHLVGQERLLYLRALEMANGNAAAAAKLLSVDAHTFRARAETLGIRKRKPRTSNS